MHALFDRFIWFGVESTSEGVAANQQVFFGKFQAEIVWSVYWDSPCPRISTSDKISIYDFPFVYEKAIIGETAMRFPQGQENISAGGFTLTQVFNACFVNDNTDSMRKCWHRDTSAHYQADQ